MLDVDDWLDNVCAEYDGSAFSGSDADSVSTQSSGSRSTSSALSFASEADELGVRRKRHDIARLVFEEGPRVVQERIKEDTLDLRDIGLTSMHDLGLLHGVLDGTDRMAVKTIDLSNNLLTEVSDYDFSHFPALDTIILKGNKQLKKVEEHAFAGVADLRVIDMSGCGLSSLPEKVFAHAPNVEVLLLEGNELSSFPDVSTLSKLSMLSAHHNKLYEAPNVSGLNKLEVLNLAHNKISSVENGGFLPDPKKSKLRCVLLNNNKIAHFKSGFLEKLPSLGVINTCDNPVWSEEHKSVTNEELCSIGYKKVGRSDVEDGDAVANQVRGLIFEDTCDKLFDYLVKHDLIKAKVLKKEIKEKRSLAHIHTEAPDMGMWLYRNGAWIALGTTLLGGGIGAVVGYVIKKSAVKRAKRIAIGAAAGAVVGGVAGYAGYRLWHDPRNFYLSDGGDDVFMTSELCSQYVGTYRLIALLAVLKQYLVACNTCLYWVVNFDEMLDEFDTPNIIVKHIERRLGLAVRTILGRISDGACVAMLCKLINDNPLDEVVHHCPNDLFDGDSLDEAALSDGASFPFLGSDKIGLVRSAICRFAQVGRVVRAMLLNRYFGTVDHCRMLQLVSDTDDLKKCLDTVSEDVLQPTLSSMVSCGHKKELWCKELQGLERVAQETKGLLGSLEKQASSYSKLLSKKGLWST